MAIISQLTRNSSRHCAPEGGDGCHGNFLWRVLLGAGVSRSDHVWLKEGTFQVHMVVGQGLVSRSQNL